MTIDERLRRLACGICPGRVWAASVLAILTPLAAAAQDSPSTTVTGRERPNSDALGIPLSGLTLFPSLTLGTEYNDNIFSEDSGRVDDVIFTVTPSMVLQSDWSTHAFALTSSATIFPLCRQPR